MKRGVFWGTVVVFAALLTVITSAQSLNIHTSALRTNTLEAKVSNGRACLAVPNGLMVVDVSDPSQPGLIGQMPSAREIFGLDMRDNMVFLACQGGLGLGTDAGDANEKFKESQALGISKSIELQRVLAHGKVGKEGDGGAEPCGEERVGSDVDKVAHAMHLYHERAEPFLRYDAGN